MKNKKRWILLVVLVLVAAGTVGYYLLPQQVESAVIGEGAVEEFVSATGRVEADPSVAVYAPISGKLSEVSCKAGDTVTEGDLIAVFDTKDYEQAYDLAKANVSYYKNGYQAAKTETDKAKKNVDTAEDDAETNKQKYYDIMTRMNELNVENRDTDVDAGQMRQFLQAEMAEYETEFSLQQSKLAVCQNQLATVEATVTSLELTIKVKEGLGEDVTEEKAELAKQKEEVKKLESKIASIEEAIEAIGGRMKSVSDELSSLPVDGLEDDEYKSYVDLQKELDLTNREWSQNLTDKATAKEHMVNDDALSQYQDSVEIAKIQMEKAKKDLDTAKAGIVSAATGVVTERNVDAGASVAAGQALFVIQPTSGYKAIVFVSRYDIEKVEKGQKATIKVGTQSYTGTVTRILEVAEVDSSGKPKVKVEVALENGGVTPAIGLEADVTISTGFMENVLTVPNTALYTDDDGDYVFLVTGGKVEKRYVTVEMKGKESSAIAEGVEAGETVILTVMNDESIGKTVR